jgi:spore coat polysaccharide biosynthesis protein SpsF
MKTIIILQARLDSTRLPNKALLPLGGEPIIARAMEALNVAPADARVLACPDACESAFTPVAAACGWDLVTGPEDDVLARFCKVIQLYDAEQVIRATGDNPFVNGVAAAAIAAEALEAGSDYAAYAGMPLGAGVEAVRAAALLRARDEARLPPEREHVCPYLYGHPEKFLLHRPLAPPQWRNPALRLTIDTAEDYAAAVKRWETVTSE